MTTPTDLTAVLIWIVAGPGAIFLVTYAFSLLAENWPAWGNFPKAVKFLVPLLVAILLAVGSQLLLTVPAVISTIQPWFALIVTIVVGWIGSQQGYMKAKNDGYGARFKDLG